MSSISRLDPVRRVDAPRLNLQHAHQWRARDSASRPRTNSKLRSANKSSTRYLLAFLIRRRHWSQALVHSIAYGPSTPKKKNIYYSPGPQVFSLEHSFPEPFSHPHLNTMPYMHSEDFEVAPRTSGSGKSIIKHRRHSKSHRCRFIMSLGTELLTIHRQRCRRKSLHIFMTKSLRIPHPQILKQKRWRTRVRLRI